MSCPLIVLDIDDTLYLERDYVRSGFSAVADYVRQNHGVHGFFEKAWAAFDSGVRRTILTDLVGEDPALAEIPGLGDRLVQVYRQHSPQITLLPDAERFLNHWVAKATLAVVTDGPVSSQRAKIEALGLSRWVTHLVVTEEYGPEWRKPSLKAFRLLQDLAGCESADCVYLADNPHKDFQGPLALGWKVVRIVRDGGLHSGEVVHFAENVPAVGDLMAWEM